MSLYHEAAAFLEATETTNGLLAGSLKSRVFAIKQSKNPLPQLYALVVESTRWSSVLSPIIDRIGLLSSERKLTPALALLLTHDLLIAKRGVSLPETHGLRQTIERHKARLKAELQRDRIKHKATDLEQWRRQLLASEGPDEDSNRIRHPRWVRVNTLRGDDAGDITAKRRRLESVSEIVRASSDSKLFVQDSNIPNLLALPADTDITKTPAYKTGRCILQDKASCIPAALLDPQPSDGHIIDACAAPGNKTTHLAALLDASSRAQDVPHGQIFAVERDPQRSELLARMVRTAGADRDNLVTCLPQQDFLRLSATDPRFANVGAILLDPSCSGSGIVGRNAVAHDPLLILPTPLSSNPAPATTKRNNSSKRKASTQAQTPAQKRSKTSEATPTTPEDEEVDVPPAVHEQDLSERLANLARFQTRILEHAMTFPRARKLVYSTCSEHAVENEGVVCAALASKAGRDGGWRVLQRAEQVPGMRSWARRGDVGAVKEGLETVAKLGDTVEHIAEACIRCLKGTEEGTMGFFCCGFVRDEPDSSHAARAEPATESASDESEFSGFGDD